MVVASLKERKATTSTGTGSFSYHGTNGYIVFSSKKTSPVLYVVIEAGRDTDQIDLNP
jgi:hypothetical protein